MTLTDDQENGLVFLKKWIADDKEMLATLSGFAGTGKTTLLKYFLKDFVGRVAISAPTHKAVGVISKTVNMEGQTLQSLHGLRPDINLLTFDIDNIIFNPIGAVKIAEYKLIIIDECSQISKSLLQLNNERADMFKVKILFVGDKYQTPPIGERISPVFKLKNMVSLTTVVRQDADNKIGKVLHLLRQDIDNNSTYLGVNYLLQNPLGITIADDGIKHGYALLNVEQFNEKLLDEFPNVNAGVDIRYIAFSNASVINTNSYIRNNLIRSDEIITKGDLLTSNTTTYDEYQSPLLFNSSDYKVLDVTKMMSDYDFEIFTCDLMDVTTNQLVPGIRVVNHNNAKGWKTYNEILNLLRQAAISTTGKIRGQNWAKYYEFKGMYLQLIKTNNGNKTVDRDLSYGYATTVHKSQGSSYDISYVNVKDIVLNRDNQFKRNYRSRNISSTYIVEYTNKLLYVALSRASQKSILLWI